MKSNFRLLALLIVFGTFFSLFAGIIFFGKSIFYPNSPLFQFISYGVAGSVTFALLQSKRYIETVIINILLFFAIFWLIGGKFFVTHLLYYLSVVIAMFVYSTIMFMKFSKVKAIRPVIGGILLSMLFLFDTLILASIYSAGITQVSPFINMPVGFLIGFGLGIGFEIAQYLDGRLKFSAV